MCDVGLERASDREITTYTVDHVFCVATNDSDSWALRLELAHKASRVVWIRLRNQATRVVEAALRSLRQAIEGIEREIRPRAA